jgi:hypothetical protein
VLEYLPVVRHNKGNKAAPSIQPACGPKCLLTKITEHGLFIAVWGLDGRFEPVAWEGPALCMRHSICGRELLSYQGMYAPSRPLDFRNWLLTEMVFPALQKCW